MAELSIFSGVLLTAFATGFAFGLVAKGMKQFMDHF
jgi:hypothetical protein